MEEQQWEQWDTNTLKTYYEQQQQELTNALLQGASWEEVKDQRDRVTELSILLYRSFSNHPAAYQSRPQQ